MPASIFPEFSVNTPMPVSPTTSRREVALFEAAFVFGDRVLIGDDDATVATVTAVTFRPEGQQVEVHWMSQGNLCSAWLAPTLLRLAPDRPGKLPSLKPVNVGSSATCVLRAEGKAAPRTCPVCGLGPCRERQ